ncbi:MAG: BlaI/MecI/CopY family transcriptional regulator [Anaerolineae bacterium]
MAERALVGSSHPSEALHEAEGIRPTGETIRVHAFKLDQRGLARVFGELEARIMDAVWQLNEPTVQDVCDHLGGDYNYKTIMTVMNRLVNKGVLTRRRRSRAYLYSPRESREAFLKHVSRHVVEGLLQDFGELTLAQFVSAVDAIEPAHLAELERLIQERMEA